MSNVVKCYFDDFNAGEVSEMLASVTNCLAHHMNEGQVARVKRSLEPSALIWQAHTAKL